MKAIKTIKRITTNLYFILFITGFLSAAFIACRLQDDYENRLFLSVSKNITAGTDKNTSQDLLIKKTLNAVSYLLTRRSAMFKNAPIGGFLDDYIHPLSVDLMTAEGACGSYSAILCRLLNTMNFETHFVQMKVNGQYGGHIVAEVKTNHGWVVLDPLYNLVFTNQQGELAGFEEISAHWQWFQRQVPANYNPQYNYQQARRTNWNKIPVLMPALKAGLSCFMTKKDLDMLCIRNFFLRKYRVCSNLLLLVIIPLLLLILKRVSQYVFNKKAYLPVFYGPDAELTPRPYAGA